MHKFIPVLTLAFLAACSRQEEKAKKGPLDGGNDDQPVVVADSSATIFKGQKDSPVKNSPPIHVKHRLIHSGSDKDVSDVGKHTAVSFEVPGQTPPTLSLQNVRDWHIYFHAGNPDKPIVQLYRDGNDGVGIKYYVTESATDGEAMVNGQTFTGILVTVTDNFGKVTPTSYPDGSGPTVPFTSCVHFVCNTATGNKTCNPDPSLCKY